MVTGPATLNQYAVEEGVEFIALVEQLGAHLDAAFWAALTGDEGDFPRWCLVLAAPRTRAPGPIIARAYSAFRSGIVSACGYRIEEPAGTLVSGVRQLLARSPDNPWLSYGWVGGERIPDCYVYRMN